MGSISPSIYETARLVATAPWLPGHRARIEHLLVAQRRDGAWGGPDAYALVPTLSATEALLGTVLAPPPRLPGALRARCVPAARAGLDATRRLLEALRAADLPDTPAVEVIVPFLVAQLRARLDELRRRDMAELDAWPTAVRLPLPRGLTNRALQVVRAALSGPAPAPMKMLHSLEVAGETAAGLPGLRRFARGPVGASPAATVAWLGPTPADRSGLATRYLRTLITAHRGPVPSVSPIINFERAWVVNSLASAGLIGAGGAAVRPPRGLAARMAAVLSSRGVAGGAGLPPDADTTSATLTALHHLGVDTRDGLLRAYDTGSHFCTWSGERTASPTTNAHVLTALASSGARRTAWRVSAIRRTADWLCDAQHHDGFWSDKWHASPFYATACVVAALRDAGPTGDDRADARRAEAVGRAVAWVRANQRRGGSWGRWSGTAEETAYALQILLYGTRPDRATRTAAERGHRFLLASQDHDPVPLWHDKDLYTPTHVVRAAVVGARHLAEQALGLT